MSLRILTGLTAGKVIAETVYNPASLTTIDTAALSTADEDVDATNLVVTGIVPSSGRIRIRLSAAASSVTAGASVHWMLRTTGGATVAGTKVRVATNTTVMRPAYDVQITGLTPGATFTYRWGQSTDNTTNKARLYVGDAGGTTVYGPASMIATAD